MNNTKKVLAALLILAATQLFACSKTVRWEEEVPLNTGQTIWVKREVVYSIKGKGGNPLDLGYSPDFTETLSFEWEGKKYRYKGEAGVMLLAISPAKQPVLVAPAADRNWDGNHNYYCTSPFYVQLVPDASGRNWTWPPEIEPWLYGMQANLMRNRDKPEEMQARYTTQQRQEADAIAGRQSPIHAHIDPAHTVTDCKKRNLT